MQIDVEWDLGFGRVEKGEFRQIFKVKGVFRRVGGMGQVKGFKNMVGGVKITGGKYR